MSVSVAVGLQGTILRVKWHRPSLQVDIPIILSRSFEDWKIAIAAYTVPPLLLCFVRHFIILPIMKKVEAREVGALDTILQSSLVCIIGFALCSFHEDVWHPGVVCY